MKIIKLTQDKEAIVDDEDYEYLNQWKWYCKQGYAARTDRTTGSIITIRMHRLINKTPYNLDTDHINRNRLDNRKANLRTVSKQINAKNKSKRYDTTTGYTGVTYNKRNKKYQCYIMVNYNRIHLGYFTNKKEAYKARVKYIKKYNLKDYPV